ncbi:MAG TPA: hypothetical protein VLT88_10235 [Desulfosarcina sp.]|nr:hypothetical protein [Desulfosarcina sp.]
MLKEIENVRQIDGEPRRRWFHDDDFDLIVWLGPDDGMKIRDRIIGFQLCYNKSETPRALTWYARSGYAHCRVDDGESKPGKYKAAPILLQNGPFTQNGIAGRFMDASRKIDTEIAAFVHEKIIAYTKEIA